jgi:hypothetical protein
MEQVAVRRVDLGHVDAGGVGATAAAAKARTTSARPGRRVAGVAVASEKRLVGGTDRPTTSSGQPPSRRAGDRLDRSAASQGR